MAKICELLKKAPVSGDLGVELEAEGDNLPVVPHGVWEMKPDNSLRGRFPDTACEYVMTKPLKLMDTLKAIKELINVGQVQKTNWNFSFRTSCHVHLNVLNLEEDELRALIYTYLLVEEPMMNYCGKLRKHNRFCLRTQDAENTIELVSQIIERGVFWFTRNTNEGDIRYAALNLGALHKYGSIEFRGMRGTADYGVLENWCRAIINLRSYAVKMGTVKAVYEDFMDSQPNEFLAKVFGEVSKVFEYPNFEQDMRLSFSITMEIPVRYKLASKHKEEKPKIAGKKAEFFVIDDLIPAGNDFAAIVGEIRDREIRRRAAAVAPRAPGHVNW